MGFVAWIKAHKKQLILVGVSIPTIIAVVLGLKNKDALKALWETPGIVVPSQYFLTVCLDMPSRLAIDLIDLPETYAPRICE